MEQLNINFEKVRNVKTPVYSSEGAAALDFFIPDDMPWTSATLRPGESVKIPSGIRVQLPEEICLVALNKSGLGAQGINSACPLIDPDYRGEIHLVVFNQSNKELTIRAGEKLIQFIATPYRKLKLNENIIESNTKRGSQGFGSTGLSA